MPIRQLQYSKTYMLRVDGKAIVARRGGYIAGKAIVAGRGGGNIDKDWGSYIDDSSAAWHGRDELTR